MVLAGQTGETWTNDEVERTVAAYFEMWRGLILNDGRTKSSRIDELAKQLPARNRAAIEYKFRNISSVLQERRDEWLRGYRPLPNIQSSLRGAVDIYMVRNGEVVALIEAHSANVIPGTTPDGTATEDVLVLPPRTRARREGDSGIATGTIGAMADFRRRELGRSGEAWVLDRERASLVRAGKHDLAAKVRWVAAEVGDGLGYDIESYAPDGSPRLIEVKTTNKGILTPFFITRNEVDVSRARRDEFSLYRVFDFRANPRIYRLDGSVDESARLTPSVFEGVPR
jgi:hypothetical protein